MKKASYYLIISFLWFTSESLEAQYGPEYLSWSGQTVIPDAEFYNVSRWTANADSGNSCYVTASDTSLDLHWKLAPGKDQWVQCFFVPDNPVSLTEYDVFGFDMHGSECVSGYPCHKEHVIEIKFEDGVRQASHTRMGEDGILCVDRWINKLFSNKYDNFFSIPEGFRWDSVRVISFGVKSHPWVDNPPADSGVVSFRNFVGDSVGLWPRAQEVDTLLESADTLNKIKEKAIEFILSRQQSTGLLTTWTEDGTAWLYGQGLALKALSIEGEWSSGTPTNTAAMAATELAHFLASHQNTEGYWPRAWNSYTGAVVVPYEDDGSIWMGDLPWMLIGLYSYFKKSGDCEVFSAIDNGETFLKSLIDPDGTLYTLNVITEQRIPVTSSEAYAAVIGALIELGENEQAETMLSHIDAETWDNDLKYWREGTYSDRIVLFTNTWLSLLAHERGYATKSLEAVSLAGRLLYTCGPGEPCGLDGIGPIAVWYEGTLSYIAAGGPASNTLFSNIRPFINADGSVPHYNDNIEGTAGIWAENWHSLDGTSWLYFVASKKTPFEPLIADYLYDCIDDTGISEFEPGEISIYPNPCANYCTVKIESVIQNPLQFRIYQPDGKLVFNNLISDFQGIYSVNVSALHSGIYFVQIQLNDRIITEKLIKT